MQGAERNSCKRLKGVWAPLVTPSPQTVASPCCGREKVFSALKASKLAGEGEDAGMNKLKRR